MTRLRIAIALALLAAAAAGDKPDPAPENLAAQLIPFPFEAPTGNAVLLTWDTPEFWHGSNSYRIVRYTRGRRAKDSVSYGVTFGNAFFDTTSESGSYVYCVALNTEKASPACIDVPVP